MASSFDEDLQHMFDTDDFAVEATLQKKSSGSTFTVTGIMVGGTASSESGRIDFEDVSMQFHINTLQTEGVVEGDYITCGDDYYVVDDVYHDASGVTILELNYAEPTD